MSNTSFLKHDKDHQNNEAKGEEDMGLRKQNPA